jgi:hypothetical protein
MQALIQRSSCVARSHLCFSAVRRSAALPVAFAPRPIWPLRLVPGCRFSSRLVRRGCLARSAATQGGYYTRVASSTALSVAAANVTNPRIDLVVAQVEDSAYSGGSSLFQVAYLTGTPTSGATLSNLSGAPSITASSLALAYVLVPANASSISGGNILLEAVTVLQSHTVSGAFSQPGRSVNTTYQPNVLRPTLVAASGNAGSGSGGQLATELGATNSLLNVVTASGAVSLPVSVMLLVPPGWFYRVATTGTVTSTLISESTL